MSGQIFQPNLTDYQGYHGGQIQAGWQSNPRDCYRPAADDIMPIICVAYNGINVANTSLTDQGSAEFKIFSPCCPPNPSTLLNAWIISRQCETPVCLTADESVAKGFDECVKKEAELYHQKLKEEGTLLTNVTGSIESHGRCEYINYDVLKKGLVRSAGGAQSEKVISIQMVLLVGLGLLLVGGGIF